jgi:hypothetical protein
MREAGFEPAHPEIVDESVLFGCNKIITRKHKNNLAT